MPQTREITVYQYDELSDPAKEKALNWMLECSYGNSDWAECTLEDAKTVGLKITEFDLDRNRHAKGEFITTATNCALAIVQNHGDTCETHKTAKAFLEKMALSNDYEGVIEGASEEFLQSLLEDYAILLQKESEYQSSREYLEEGIRANEYEFLETGKRA